ncbi:Shedu immune nuclease family protein, partial [Frankia sp. AgB32]|uniref:Shedu immune nuclease family protein n=1 Tax=Frankia sp. AgB32 TaxID=631119 RepID=UPI00200FCAB5
MLECVDLGVRRGPRVIINFSLINDNTYFNTLTDNFSTLEVRPSGKSSGLYYFYDTSRSRLVTDFILDDLPRVETLCRVTLIKSDGAFSPRLSFWKRDKTQPGKKKLKQEVASGGATREIKAVVDTGDGWRGLWKLIGFLQGFRGIELPSDTFRIFVGSQAKIAEVLQGADKSTVVEAVRSALGGRLTERDIELLADRKGQLEEFRRLLEDPDYFAVKHSQARGGREKVWQNFFEGNPWIFGYGLQLVSCDPADADKLEQITAGTNFMTGAGKRVDGLLLTRGFVSSLLFCEIKHHETPLLRPKQYREPDVYQVSDEVSGGFSQVQKTAYKAVRGIVDNVRRHHLPDGTPTDISYSLVRPRQVLVLGNMDQLMINGQINPEKSSSFELFRRSMYDVEILTFDELYRRAQYIVKEDIEQPE